MIEGAKEHIASLKEGIEAFVHQDNWTGIIEAERETGDHIAKVQFKTDFPNRLALRVYDAAGYLRTALDHAAYASAVLTSGGDPKRTKFPFGDTLDDLNGEIKRRRCEDMHDDIIKLVLAFEPYEAGNQPLWALNKMRNRTNHRVLMPTSAVASGFGIVHGRISGKVGNISEWKATRRQLSFMRIWAGAKFDMHVVPTINIVLNPSLGFAPQPAVTVLNDLAGEVERIVMAIEAETLRIVGG